MWNKDTSTLKRILVASWVEAIDLNNPNEVKGCLGAKKYGLIVWPGFKKT